MSETRQVKRAATIHREKLFKGRYTAEEVHSRYAFPPGSRCSGCNTQTGLATRFISLAPLDEMKKRDPMYDLLASDPRGWSTLHKMLVHIKGADGKAIPYIRIATAYACRRCTPEAEKAAAHGPSWIQVEINRGSGPEKFVSGYTGAEYRDDTSIIELAVERYSQPRSSETITPPEETPHGTTA